MMRIVLVVAALLSIGAPAVSTSAQGQAGQNPSNMDPLDLAANCQALKKGSARQSRRTTPDPQKLAARCADLDRHTAVGARQR